MCREPKPRRAFTSTGYGISPGSSPGSQVGGLAIPFASKKRLARYLSSQSEIVSGPGQEHERAEPVAVGGEHAVVEVRERDDQLDSVLLDECARARRRIRIADGRHGRADVGRVERGRELVQVDGDRGRARAPRRPVTMSTRCPAQVKSTTDTGRNLHSAPCAVRSSRKPRSSPGRPGRTATTSCGACSRKAGRFMPRSATSTRPRRSSG